MPLERRVPDERRPRSTSSSRLCVVFSVAGVRYAIDSRRVHRAARTVDALDCGPALDLRSLFALSGERKDAAVVLIVEGAGTTAALGVDEIISLARVDESAVVALPPIFDGSERQWIEALVRLERRVVPLLDAAGLAASAHAA
jgi:CheW-like protein